jgi:hypothetical protein
MGSIALGIFEFPPDVCPTYGSQCVDVALMYSDMEVRQNRRPGWASPTDWRLAGDDRYRYRCAAGGMDR